MTPYLKHLALALLVVFTALPPVAHATDGGDPALGGELFQAWACGGCHVLADAGASGAIGPSLDGNPNLSFGYIVNRIESGAGAMPSFAGQLTEDEIASLAAYILEVAESALF